MLLDGVQLVGGCVTPLAGQLSLGVLGAVATGDVDVAAAQVPAVLQAAAPAAAAMRWVHQGARGQQLCVLEQSHAGSLPGGSQPGPSSVPSSRLLARWPLPRQPLTLPLHVPTAPPPPRPTGQAPTAFVPGTCTLATLPLRLLLWLSDTGWLLQHKASKAKMPPTQSPIRQTWGERPWGLSAAQGCHATLLQLGWVPSRLALQGPLSSLPPARDSPAR